MSEAKLIWITPDAEKVIGYCARVSNPKNQDNPDVSKLLAYCFKNSHVSIFEMASACLEIKTSRTIARQILRHSSFNFQEFSQRYSGVTEFYVLNEARSQDTKNRQNSVDDFSEEVKAEWNDTQKQVWQVAWDAYQEALAKGIAKEVARSVLPEGMTNTTMYMSGTIRSWLTYLMVRLGNGTQKEHVDVAKVIKEVLSPHLPTVMSLI